MVVNRAQFITQCASTALIFSDFTAELILETCVFTKNRLQVSVIPPHLTSCCRHVSKSHFLESLQISRVSLQGAPACSGRPDGAISWPPQSSACMWLVLTQIPLSSNACLDPSQPAPGRPGSKGIFTRRFCVGPASPSLALRQWESCRLSLAAR